MVFRKIFLNLRIHLMCIPEADLSVFMFFILSIYYRYLSLKKTTILFFPAPSRPKCSPAVGLLR